MSFENTYIKDIGKDLGKTTLTEREKHLDKTFVTMKKRMLALDDAKREMQLGFKQVLEGLSKAYTNLNLQDPNLLETPDRMARAMIEVCAGLGSDEDKIFSTSFQLGSYDHVVMVKDISFVSLCAHHFFPFVGKVHIGYLPCKTQGKVVGLSKLARIVDAYATRPQLQEQLCSQIKNAIVEQLSPEGVITIIEGKHSCMGCRGPKKPEASMVTTAFSGKFTHSKELKNEFLNLLNLKL